MTRPAFQRDGILNDDERATSARKCIKILDTAERCTDGMNAKDYTFYLDQRQVSKNIKYAPSEPQLQWLRDLVDRYT